MPIPFLIGAAIVGAVGVSAVNSAKEKSEKAESLVKDKESQQKLAIQELEEAHELCTESVENLDALKQETLNHDIARFLTLYKKIGDLNISLKDIDTSFEYSENQNEISAIDASYHPTADIAVKTIGSALLIGGGFIAVPTLLWSIISASNKADEALTEAKKYAAKVDVRCQEMENDKALLQAISIRCTEFEAVIGELRSRLKTSLDALEEVISSYNGVKLNNDEIQKVHQSFSLAKSLKDVLSVNILDSNGELTDESEDASCYLPQN